MLTVERLSTLLSPYVAGLELLPGTYDRCAAYLDLLLRWNSRTNLTAVRDPEHLATRQLGESLFAARCLGNTGTLLDFGSGAGFPGIPLLLARPGLTVTLAESQGKKASFLREAERMLALGCEVWSGRVEELPTSRQFDVVTMRAVDRSEAMTAVAAARIAEDGVLLRFESNAESSLLNGWTAAQEWRVPQSEGRLVALRRDPAFHVEHCST